MNLLFVPFMSGREPFNGDLPTMTFGFSAQSDESRHMTTLGLRRSSSLLEQDPTTCRSCSTGSTSGSGGVTG